MNRTKDITTVAACVAAAFLMSDFPINAAAPPTAQGAITFRTFPGDQRPAIRAGTATPDGSFYPKRMEGPYNGYPDADPGDDNTLPVDIRNNYNMNLIGYFYPPKTGKIQFAIATDDPGELWLSTDDSPANKVLIANEPNWNPKRAFGGAWDPLADPDGDGIPNPTATRRPIVTMGAPPIPRPVNWSPYIQVTQGKPYYIEAIATEFGGGDNCAVAFRYEGDPDFMDGDLPISGQYLSTIDRTSLSGVYPSGLTPSTTGFVMTIHDGDPPGGASVDAATVTAQLDGTAIAVTVTKAPPVSTITYVKTNGVLLSLSTHTAKLDFKDTAGTASSITRNFTVPYYLTLTPDMKVTPDATKPGFLWNVTQNSAVGASHTLIRTEAQLSGAIKGADGNPLPNLADPSAVGGAAGAAQAPNPAWAPISFNVTGVINFDQAAGANGNFQPDLQMPGIPSLDPAGDPASSDNIAAEIITYLELPAGAITMGVNSDDDFWTTAGIAGDVLNPGKPAGQFDGNGRGAADTLFPIVVQEAGVYPFRTIWEEGTGGANIEWFTVTANGTNLLNDTASGGFKAYRAITDAKALVRRAQPAPGAVGVPTDIQILVELVDGANPIPNTAVSLKLDGNAVAAAVNKAGNVNTVSFKPATAFTPKSQHTATLLYTEAAAQVTREWQFTVVNPALLAYWDFNDASNPTNAIDKVAGIKGNLISPAADSQALYSAAGQGHTGTAADRALDLGSTGDGQRLEVNGDSATFFLNEGGNQDQLAMSFWQKLTELRNSSAFWSGGPAPGIDRYFQAHVPWGDSTIYFDTSGCCDGTTQRIAKNLADFPDPGTDPATYLLNWHHFVFQKNGPTKQIWIDGKLFLERQSFGPLLKDFDAFQIGTFAGGGSTYGLLDDFAVWASALTPAEITRLFQGTAPDQLRATAPPAPRFNAPTFAGGSVRLSWIGAGRLEEATALTGPWGPSGNQTNPQDVTAVGTKFYRIVNP